MPAAKPEGVTLTRWLCDEIRGAILSGKLKRGWALPATRQLAQTAGSPGTLLSTSMNSWRRRAISKERLAGVRSSVARYWRII